MRNFFIAYLLFVLILPNFSFAKLRHLTTIKTPLIQEIKTEGKEATSHYGEWIEISNNSLEEIDLSQFCIVSKKESNSSLASYNCFPKINLLPNEITIIAYSGYEFLKDIGFDLEDIKERVAGESIKDILGGYLFELGDRTISEEAIWFSNIIPDMESVSKSRLYLNDDKGEVFLFKRNTQEIVDHIKWELEIGKDFSFSRPVYNLDYSFVISKPSPFRVFPLFVDLISEKINLNEASFEFNKISDILNPPPQEIILFEKKDNGLSIIYRKEEIPLKILFNNLKEDTFYILEISSKVSIGIFFNLKVEFKTLKSFPNLYLNEIYPSPSPGRKEFIEIYNPNNFTLDLNSWSLKDKAGNKIILQGTMEPFGFMAIFPPFSLNDDGEEIYLIDPNNSIKDKVSYDKAFKDYAYIFNEGKNWLWSRVATPSSKNFFVPLYIQKTIKEAKEDEDKVEVKGKIIIPPQVFGNYFYIGEGNESLKINTSNKYAFKENECLVFRGEIKKTPNETYLNLKEYQKLAQNFCEEVYFPNINSLESLAKLALIKGEIFSEKSSYFIKFKNLKIKLRSNGFRFKKEIAQIKGVLGYGETYYQLFVLKPEWIEYEAIDSLPSNIFSPLNLLKIDEGGNVDTEPNFKVKSSFYNMNESLDYRKNEDSKDNHSLGLVIAFIPYYLSIIGWIFIAKILFLT